MLCMCITTGPWSTSGSMSLSHVAAALHSEHHFPSLAGKAANNAPKWPKGGQSSTWKANTAVNLKSKNANQIVGAKLSKNAADRLTGADLVKRMFCYLFTHLLVFVCYS